MWAPQKGVQVISEGDNLILRVNYTNICFDKRVENNSGKEFLFPTKFYKSENYADILSPKTQNPEGNAVVQPEGVAVKRQEKEKPNN